MCHSGGLHHREPCPPSQPTTAASAWKTLRVERTQRPPSNNHSPSQQPAPANQASAVRVPDVTGPHRPTSRPGYAPAVSCWARVFQRSIGPWWPRFIHRGPVHERATKYFVTGAPSFKKRGLPLLLSKPQEPTAALHSSTNNHKCCAPPSFVCLCWAARGIAIFGMTGPGRRRTKGAGPVTPK